MSNGRGGTQKKSRVNLKYEVETNGAIKQQDLKAVVGVMSDLSFDSSVQKKDISQRAFLEVNKENFDNRMAEVRPAVALEVPNVLDASGGSLPAKIEFKNAGTVNKTKKRNGKEKLNRRRRRSNTLRTTSRVAINQIMTSNTEKLRSGANETVRQPKPILAIPTPKP